ncbi:ribosomal protein S11 family protein [Striga asiatica]|uniref:Ribosomal protein S11 family protein n=1 Tax=Striga asiatica TaxID=4170 RepID=A0A5A7QNW5_STRAF|nr:ribosomal protein S11 family protein [Striga asiatica]
MLYQPRISCNRTPSIICFSHQTTTSSRSSRVHVLSWRPHKGIVDEIVSLWILYARADIARPCSDLLIAAPTVSPGSITPTSSQALSLQSSKYSRLRSVYDSDSPVSSVKAIQRCERHGLRRANFRRRTIAPGDAAILTPITSRATLSLSSVKNSTGRRGPGSL